MATKQEISDFKKKADDFNRGIYADLKSYRIGLVLILIAVSVYLLITFMG
jgi:hypothetical protein